MANVMFFIDGFNVYHSLKSKSKYHKYLWLNYRSIAERFKKKGDTISKIYYFSAYATWKPHSMKRHRKLMDALKSKGVDVILGKFKKKDRYCKICGASFIAREEKQTDVNIAIYLFKEAYKNNYDTAFIMTNDTDLIPAIKMVKSEFPSKRLGILFPIDRSSIELKNVCHFWRAVQKKDLSKSQLPDQVELPSGVILTRPRSWKK
ncbi:MAG: NYN domain-containing protein [Deltaproteobacteria bacterium]|nr:NYN domain-containing protein [Deltaproteobacteria bacterium]